MIFDIGFFANDVINFAQAWESGSKADLRDASIALIIDAAALILPAVPAVAGVMIRGGKAADRAADAVRATGEANNAAKAGQGAAKAAEGAKKAEQSKQALGSEKALQQQYGELGRAGGPKAGSTQGPGSGKRASPSQRTKTLSENGGKCVFCGKPAKHADHAIPKSRGGDTTTGPKGNLQPACPTCNQQKGAKTSEEYLEWLDKHEDTWYRW